MKLTKKQLGFSFVAVALLVLLLSSQGIIPKFSLTGASPLSCDNAEYKSSDPNYEDGSLFCSMALTGSGKEAEFVFSDSYAKEKFGVGTETTGTFNAKLLGSPCSYRADNTTNYLYKYNVVKRMLFSQTTGRYYCGYPSDTDRLRDEQMYGTPMGATPISCKNNNCIPGNVLGGCEYVFKKSVGVIHYLDPSTFNDFQAELSMTVDGQTKSGIISQQSKNLRTDFFTAEYLFSGQGEMSCPAQPAVTLFIENTLTSTPISYRDRFLADAVLQDQLTIVDAQTATLKASSHNILIDRYLASSASTGQYCTIDTTTAQTLSTAKVSCIPTGTTSIPVFNLYVNADTMRIVIPSGTPKILNVSASKALSATRSEVTVKATNLGEADSFDVSLQCKNDLSPFSTRTYLASNEVKDVLVNYEGAGLIGDCSVSMISVNSPDKIDEQTIRLSIYPFCAKSAPSPAHQLVFTEKGCAYICPNYKTNADGSTDVFDANCAKITEYDRCNYDGTDCVSKDSYSGIHCTGAGTYLTTNRYMDEVKSGTDQFIPSEQNHKYWVTSVDGQPVCAYMNEYGYKDGVALSELTFDYSAGYPEASLGQSTVSDTGGIPEIPVEQGGKDNTILYLVGGIAVVIIGVVLIKRVRK